MRSLRLFPELYGLVAGFLPSAIAPTPQRAAGERALWLFVLLQVVGIVFFQKLGLPVGQTSLELLGPVLFGGVAALVVFGRTAVDPIRLLLYALFCLCAVSSQLLAGQKFSVPSLGFALLLYAPLALKYEVTPEFYQRFLRLYQNLMLAIVFLVVAQQVVQVALSWRFWPNLDRILPLKLQFPGYNYLQPMHWGARYYKPNAVVFLETSFLSQYLALALVVELVFFQRVTRLAAYATALLLTFAGTGILVLALCSPLLLARMSARIVVPALIACVVACAVALMVGWVGQVAGRLAEFQHPGSSAYFRFVMPIRIVLEQLARPEAIYTGEGAGQTAHIQGYIGNGFILIPPAKIVFEYGLLTFFAFYALVCYSVFAGAPSFRLALALFLIYNLGAAGFIVPLSVSTLIIFGTLLRPTAAPIGQFGWRPPIGSPLPAARALVP